MPELPEVETVRRGLERTTLGYTIVGGDVRLERTIAYPLFIAAFLDGLQGYTFTTWERHGKYLCATLTDATGQTCGLGVHLRMTGQLLWCDRRDPVQKHTRVRLFCELQPRDESTNKPTDESTDQPTSKSTDKFTDQPTGKPDFAYLSANLPADFQPELRFVDTRTFGQMWWIPPQVSPAEVVTGLQKLGPEPLGAEFTTPHFAAALAGRKRPIKTALLDQTIVAGIGNIYADESLFLSKIHPTIHCCQLTMAQVDILRQNIVQVLQDSIALGGTTFSDFKGVTGINGRYGGVARVYNRTGQPCVVCQTLIGRLRLAGRSAHFCPQCQPLG